jgi:hypothetical protein
VANKAAIMAKRRSIFNRLVLSNGLKIEKKQFQRNSGLLFILPFLLNQYYEVFLRLCRIINADTEGFEFCRPNKTQKMKSIFLLGLCTFILFTINSCNPCSQCNKYPNPTVKICKNEYASDDEFNLAVRQQEALGYTCQ